jgi:hypothetical protein
VVPNDESTNRSRTFVPHLCLFRKNPANLVIVRRTKIMRVDADIQKTPQSVSGYIILSKVLRARSEQRLPIHATDRDFAQRANREQRLPDVLAIGGSRHELTTGSREIQPALLLSWSSGVSALGSISRRDSAQPWFLHVGTPSVGSSHCVKIM